MSISVRNLTKTFANHTAVENVSFEVEQNQFFTIVGASGCGKSTLLRLLAGLEIPERGEITLDGHPMVAPGRFVAPEERRVGVVFQSYALWPHMSVLGNVAFPYEARGTGAAEAARLAAGHLATVSLDQMAERCPANLSGGQRQRVALARCLAGDARTILMDEPLANLDPHLRNAMEHELAAFHRSSGATTLYITHDQREAMALADRMAVMDRGRFLQVGTPQDIYERPANATVAGFIGRGALVPVEHVDGSARLGAQMFQLRRSPGQGNGPATAFLRPHDIVRGEGGTPARITTVHYRGGVWEAEALLEGLAPPLAIDLPSPARVGDMVPLRIVSGWLLPG